MRFHLIDHIAELEPGRRVRGIKVTSRSEEHWELDGSRPVMPAPLVLEALCQAGTWLVVETTQHRRRAALLSMGEVSFLGQVHPGDVVTLDGWVEAMSDEMAVLSGRASVDGRTVLEASQIMCALIDVPTLEDEDSTARMLALLRTERP